MKRTITCLAIIASATSAYAGPKAQTKKDERKPATADGKKYLGCKPAGYLYQGDQAYRNDCLVNPDTVKDGAQYGFGRHAAVACPVDHDVVVSAYPVVGSCLPPGAVEL